MVNCAVKSKVGHLEVYFWFHCSQWSLDTRRKHWVGFRACQSRGSFLYLQQSDDTWSYFTCQLRRTNIRLFLHQWLATRGWLPMRLYYCASCCLERAIDTLSEYNSRIRFLSCRCFHDFPNLLPTFIHPSFILPYIFRIYSLPPIWIFFTLRLCIGLFYWSVSGEVERRSICIAIDRNTEFILPRCLTRLWIILLERYRSRAPFILLRRLAAHEIVPPCSITPQKDYNEPDQSRIRSATSHARVNARSFYWVYAFSRSRLF